MITADRVIIDSINAASVLVDFYILEAEEEVDFPIATEQVVAELLSMDAATLERNFEGFQGIEKTGEHLDRQVPAGSISLLPLKIVSGHSLNDILCGVATDVDCAGVEFPVDCGDGATCVDASSGGGYTCVCGDGYRGNDASSGPAICTDIDGCIGIDCGLDATCIDVGAPGTGYTCASDETLDREVFVLALLAAIVCVLTALISCWCYSRQKSDDDTPTTIVATQVLDAIEDPETGKHDPSVNTEEASALYRAGGNMPPSPYSVEP